MKKKIIIVVSVISLILIIFCVFVTLNKNDGKYLVIKLKGKKKLVMEYGEKYKEKGASANYKNNDLTKNIKTKCKLNLKKLGNYYCTYKITYKGNIKSAKRIITIKDSKAPEIKLNGDEQITIYLNEKYIENGATASDNYDGDITDKISIQGEVDTKTKGSYKITYNVKDSSNNETSVNRIINVIEKEEKKIDANKTSKGFKIEQINGIYYINGILIANKSYNLPSSYNPGELLTEFQVNFDKMQSDAANSGIGLKIISGFRSYNSQQSIYNNYVARDGQALADRYSARPGYSEHQSGLAADINSLDQSFENTSEGKWLNENCYKYGFIIRYVKGKEDITGYMFEPWHIRYVGTDLSNKLYNGGNWITLEEYFGIDSRY